MIADHTISPVNDKGGDTEYRISWTINIEADSAEEAVRKARWHLLNNSKTQVYSVISALGEGTVDLYPTAKKQVK